MKGRKDTCPKCGAQKWRRSAQCGECLKQGRSRRVEKICEECGLPFSVLPHRAKKARLCSLSCNSKKGNRVNPVHPRTHGHTVDGQSPTYKSWHDMKDRCQNPKNGMYPHYGGRGIAVCERWNAFASFLADMGTRPPGTTIDRKDVNGNYEPSNCRWATVPQQADNTTRTIYLTFRGETLTLTQWATRLGVNRETLRSRLALGWAVEKAFTKPVALRRAA